MRTILLTAVLLAFTASVAPRHHGPRMPRFNHATNSFEVEGVTMPPKYTEEQWKERQAVIEAFNKKLAEADEAINAAWLASLNQEQKDAIDAEKVRLTKEQEERQATARRRQWEMEGITNRLAWVKNEFKDKRRVEREYHPGLKWMDSEIVKETITIGESGKVKIHFIYTADGKKHRFDPDSIERTLRERAMSATLNAIIKED